MTATDLDPWADPDIEGSKREMAERPSTFLTSEDLMGRHMFVVCKSIEWKQGDKDKYESITADLIILDGRKTEKIPTLPRIEYNKFLSGLALVGELRKYVPGSGDPDAGRPVLGYFTILKKAHYLEKPDADTKKAPSTRDAWELYKSGNTPQGQASDPPF